MKKVVIKILQGNVVTQTTLSGLTIYPEVANFLKCTCAINYENLLPVDKVIAKISRLTFLAHPVDKIHKITKYLWEYNKMHIKTLKAHKIQNCTAMDTNYVRTK